MSDILYKYKKDLLICLGLSFMIVIVMEIAKAFGYKKHN